jgi:RNA polymerase sigma factor (sigma-70 family)
LRGESCPSAQTYLSCLRRITQHKVANAFQRHHGTKKRDHVVECSLPAELPSKSPSATQEVDCLDQLEQALQSLPFRERLTVSLRVEGYSNAEIAAVLEVTEQTVRNILHRLEGQPALTALK